MTSVAFGGAACVHVWVARQIFRTFGVWWGMKGTSHITMSTAPLAWEITAVAGAVCASFRLRGELLSPGDLPGVTLPAGVAGRERDGLILSGRGPIWLYLHLAHLAHPFAWVAAHDPRLGGAVVVQRHRPDAPGLGEVVEVPPPEAVPSTEGGDADA